MKITTTRRLGYFVALFVAVLYVTATAADRAAGLAVDDLVIETAQAQHPFRVELAITPEQRSRGLMYRRNLPDGHGMLFHFGEPRPVTMWMRNTYVSLDMLFIAGDGEIRRIVTETTPLSTDTITSDGPVLAVLELPAGTAERLGLQVGDRVRYPWFDG